MEGRAANSIVFAIDGILADPDDYLAGYLVPGNGRNREFIEDKNLNELIQKEQQESHEGKRLQLVHQAQQMEADLQYYPMAISASSTTFMQPWVQGSAVCSQPRQRDRGGRIPVPESIGQPGAGIPKPQPRMS